MPSVPLKAKVSLMALLGFAALAVAEPPKPVAESPILSAKDKQRLVDLTAQLDGAKELYLMVADLGANACDWSDWIEPEVVLVDGTVLDLTKLKWKEAEATGTVRVGKNYDGKSLKVAGQEYARGIGTHANSFIAYQLPGPAKTFRAKVAIDDGGAIRGGKASSADVRFAVFTTRPDKYKPVDFDAGPNFVPPELFTVPDGFEVTVWATSPQVFNPTNIDFDERGRMYVAEGVNYRSKAGRRKEGDDGLSGVRDVADDDVAVDDALGRPHGGLFISSLRKRGKAAICLRVAQALRGTRLHRSGEVRCNAALLAAATPRLGESFKCSE